MSKTTALHAHRLKPAKATCERTQQNGPVYMEMGDPR